MVLVTGVAGFIGSHLALRLLALGHAVTGVDLACKSEPGPRASLKAGRLARLCGRPGFDYVELDIVDRHGLARLFKRKAFHTVVHLAARSTGCRKPRWKSASPVSSTGTGTTMREYHA